MLWMMKFLACNNFRAINSNSPLERCLAVRVGDEHDEVIYNPDRCTGRAGHGANHRQAAGSTRPWAPRDAEWEPWQYVAPRDPPLPKFEAAPGSPVTALPRQTMY